MSWWRKTFVNSTYLELRKTVEFMYCLYKYKSKVESRRKRLLFFRLRFLNRSQIFANRVLMKGGSSSSKALHYTQTNMAVIHNVFFNCFRNQLDITYRYN